MNMIFESRPRVYDDIIEAVEYFISINPKLAEQFLDRIEQAKQKILKNPKGFQIKHSTSVRTILMDQFDYHIYFVIEENK